MSKPKHFYTCFDIMVYDGTINNERSKTEQHFADDCDINIIYKRFVKENGYDPLDTANYTFDLSAPVFDISNIKNMSDVFDMADFAHEAFYQLPAEVREKFENNPSKLRQAVETMSDDELARYGLYDSTKTKGDSVNATQTKPQNIQTDVSKDGPESPQA